MTEPGRRQVPVDLARWFDHRHPEWTGGAWGAVLAWLAPPVKSPSRD